MASTLDFSTKHVFLPFLIIISFVAHQFHLTVAKPTSTGFSLKLVHRDSPESPFYPGNLSYFHQMQRLVNLSETRYLELQSRSTKTVPSDDLRPDIIRPRVGTRGNLYYVSLSIGTPSKPHILALDTGSSLIWIQCKPCNDKDCFKQIHPIFDPGLSSSYRTVPCGHPLCEGMKCIDGRCIYLRKYAGGQTSKGVLSNETFTFQSNTGASEMKNGIVFGCSNNSQKFNEFEGDGILGMDYSELSLIGQIKRELTKQQFSYCLVPPRIRRTSFLRLGDDNIKAPRGSRVQTTPFVRTSYPLFALTLQDISVENNRIRFPPGAFAPKHDGTGGCFIDTGSTITFMDAQPYGDLRRAIMRHFEQYHLQTVQFEPFDLCYHLPGGFNHFPKVTFHFQNADLEVMPENMFFINYNSKVFCLGMKPVIKGKTIIGAMQQQNTRFVYQIAEDKLSFFPEDCSQDMG